MKIINVFIILIFLLRFQSYCQENINIVMEDSILSYLSYYKFPNINKPEIIINSNFLFSDTVNFYKPDISELLLTDYQLTFYDYKGKKHKMGYYLPFKYLNTKPYYEIKEIIIDGKIHRSFYLYFIDEYNKWIKESGLKEIK